MLLENGLRSLLMFPQNVHRLYFTALLKVKRQYITVINNVDEQIF